MIKELTLEYCWKSRLHVGTRYLARGLNCNGEPGNEVECEQIIWKPKAESTDEEMWTSFLFRRGTVPLRYMDFSQLNPVLIEFFSFPSN